MTIAPIDHIALDERGIAYIGGSQLKVTDIVIDSEHWGLSAREIQENYPRLSLAQIHAALAYYHDHKTEIDRQIEADTQEVERLRKSQPNPLRRPDLEARLGVTPSERR
jgi:uncharacterized protein (DUF433 family)